MMTIMTVFNVIYVSTRFNFMQFHVLVQYAMNNQIALNLGCQEYFI